MRFEDIYKKYYRDVYYFLLSLSSNPELSEELTQETFYRALKNIHKFKGECQLHSWLCQIGKHAYLSWMKKASCRKCIRLGGVTRCQGRREAGGKQSGGAVHPQG